MSSDYDITFKWVVSWLSVKLKSGCQK